MELFVTISFFGLQFDTKMWIRRRERDSDSDSDKRKRKEIVCLMFNFQGIIL